MPRQIATCRSWWPVFLVTFLLGVCIASPDIKGQQSLLVSDRSRDSIETSSDSLQWMINALDVMQDTYFELWQGVWPTAIDWTAAVLGTYLAAALATLSSSLEYGVMAETPMSVQALTYENIINRYFSQLVSFYFGQDAFALRTEAYDDMLWVVLGWLESIKFINVHSSLHYQEFHISGAAEAKRKKWHGKQWIPTFAHRARIFWDLASQGWDTSLCHGGMIWSPYLTPYKNAITNELYITASISMYLYFPGDENYSPFLPNGPVHPTGTQDPKYLAAAIQGYKWLRSSNMTDEKGLYVDGYHISGWDRHGRHTDTKCDARNDMVYTYNQGVLLSGQRGLWEATAARSYLEDGHELIKSVINATGYDLKHDKVYFEEGRDNNSRLHLPKWHGIGRRGILEEACDAFGYCGQDGQTFKGIFFHHLTLFCAPIPPPFLQPGKAHNAREFGSVKVWHEESCGQYAGWIRRNAEAAVTTKDKEGKFGSWWGATKTSQTATKPTEEIPHGAVDYRNQGVPHGDTWGVSSQKRKPYSPKLADHEARLELRGIRMKDANDRGRGRTVETQGGGVAVLRALWEVVDTRPKTKRV